VADDLVGDWSLQSRRIPDSATMIRAPQDEICRDHLFRRDFPGVGKTEQYQINDRFFAGHNLEAIRKENPAEQSRVYWRALRTASMKA
jgi:hypothetical protein